MENEYQTPLLVVLAVTVLLALAFAIAFFYTNKYTKLLDKIFTTPQSVVDLFPTKSHQVPKITNSVIDEFTASIESIVKIEPGKRTFTNTFATLDRAIRKFKATDAIISLLEMVHPSAKMRDICRIKKIELNTVFLDKVYTKELYAALNDYAAVQKINKIDKFLLPEQTYFMEHFLETLRNDGLGLEDTAFARYKEIQKQLMDLTTTFDTNINAAVETLKFSEAELDGTNEDWLKSLPRTEDGLCKVGLNTPSVTEILENCHVKNTRKQMLEAYNSRAWPENEELFNQILALRAEGAALLDQQDFAHQDLKMMMAGHPQTVNKFLHELNSLAQPKMHQELELLRKELPDGIELEKDGKFALWDLPYVRETYRKQHLAIDNNLVKEYFPLQSTMEGLFSVYENLLGVQFVVHDRDDLWFENLQILEVKENSSNRILGFILLDLHPRDFKYSHACMMPMFSAMQHGHKLNPAFCAVIANLPQDSEGKPALLKLNDVRTFFHEFGHAMHCIMSKTQTDYFSGTNVLHDFVETPSMMFEEFLWQPEILKQVSKHYKTDEPLPDDLIARIIDNRSFDSGHFVARQVALANYSLACHSTKDGSVDLQRLWQDVFNQSLPEINPAGTLKMHASWGHLTGYKAKYYTYLWSLVFACDLFQSLYDLGLQTDAAKQKIRTLLSAGGSIMPNELLQNCLERQPSMQALAERRGLNS